MKKSRINLWKNLSSVVSAFPKKVISITLMLTLSLTISPLAPAKKASAAWNRGGVLDLLRQVGASSNIITGQNAGDGLDTYTNGYTTYVENLKNATGKYVGIVGTDYEYDGKHTLSELSQINSVLTSHWNKGGFVEISWSARNPWTGGDVRDRSSVVLSDLVDPAKPIYTTWHNELDRIASALTELKNNGVTVLWRPFHEMNANWFWWDYQDKTAYKNLWIDMYNYLTATKKLDNLIWVYAPWKYAGDNNVSWCQTVDYYYPGDNYVDVCGIDVYQSDLATASVSDINTLAAHNKPVALCESGTNTSYTGGAFDNMEYIKAKRNNPKLSYFMCWSDWDNVTVSIKSNSTNQSAMMNSNEALTADELNTQSINRLSTNPGFEGDLTGWNTSGGTLSGWIDTANARSGGKCFSLWSDKSYTGSLLNLSAQNLDAGTYTATVYVKNNGMSYGDFQASVNSGTPIKTVLTNNSSYTAFQIKNITVPAGGSVKLSIWYQGNANSWTYFDDFSLTKN